MVRMAPEGLWRADTAGRCLFVNQGWCKLTGMKASDAHGRGWERILHPDDRERLTALWSAAVRAGKSIRMEYRIRVQGGREKWLFTHAVPERDATGELMGYIGTAVDLTERKALETALRESEERYRQFVEMTPDGVGVVFRGKCIFANAALAGLLGGKSGDEFTGKNVLEWFHSGSRARVAAWLASPPDMAKSEALLEERLTRRRGDPVEVEIAALPFLHQNQPATLMILRDITRRKRTIEALRESESLFRQVVDSDMVGILFWDVHGNITHANSVFLNMIGFTPKDVLIGRVRWDDITPPDYVHLDQIALKELAEKGVFTPFEKEYVRPDGRRVPVLLGGALLQGSKDKGVSFCLDITKRRRVEQERDNLFQELRQAHDRLRALSSRLVEVQEAERRRIARELHDEVGQELTALKLELQSAGTQSQNTPTRALASVDRLLSLIRDMSLELRPTMLDDLGLTPALHWQCDRHSTLGRLRVEFRHNGVEGRRFPSDIETAAYRIVQEALTNVVRHSGAGEAQVRVWAGDTSLAVQIEDRGRGFDVETALSPGISSGLSGMRERVALLGGRFSIESTRRDGTILTAELPLSGPPGRLEPER